MVDFKGEQIKILLLLIHTLSDKAICGKLKFFGLK